VSDLPDPSEYEELEAWLADVMSAAELDSETMGEIIEKLGRSPWVEQR
jgi:hypothetical protein